MENKDGFVKGFQLLLIENGAGRYDYLKERPVAYERDEHGEEFLVRRNPANGAVCSRRCVSANSLTAIAEDILKMI